jgi:hypothetical protein
MLKDWPAHWRSELKLACSLNLAESISGLFSPARIGGHNDVLDDKELLAFI